MILTMTGAPAQADFLHVYIDGKLTREDYTKLEARLQQKLKYHEKTRLLFELQTFDGWSPGALWDEIKFDVKHFNDIDRVAIVGGTNWEKQMARLYKPFTRAEVRYFPLEDSLMAQKWLSDR